MEVFYSLSQGDQEKSPRDYIKIEEREGSMAWGLGHSNIQRLADKTESTSETEEEWSVSMERHQGRFESWKGNSSK